MNVTKLIELLAKHDSETEVCMTSRIDQGTSITSINHVGHDKHGNLVITYSDNLVVKTRDAQEEAQALADKYREVQEEAQEARAVKDQELINAHTQEAQEARALADKYREAQEALADKYQDQDQEGQDQALADKYREVRKALADKYQDQDQEVETLTLALAQEVREARKAQADKYHKALADKAHKTQEAKTQEALADKDQELINARALYVRQAREAREAYTVQLNAKLARELTLARVDALWHWEDCFLTGVVDDEHRVFIAEVLAEAAHALEENDND